MGLTRDHRRSLLDQLDPADRRLKAGLILTYSAEAAPLVAVLSTLAGHPLSGDEATNEGFQDAFRIMRDIESLSGRLRVLLNVGGLRTPGGAGDRMAALLDSVIREVVPMKDGQPDTGCSFHPKLLLFEYEAVNAKSKASASEIRMFVCTRNITTDDSMDTITSLRLIERKSPTDNGRRLKTFLEAALRESNDETPVEIEKLVKRIEKMALEPLHDSPGIEAVEFFGQVAGAVPLSKQMEINTSDVLERIVISPFIDKTTLGFLNIGGQSKVSLLSERRDFAKVCTLSDGVEFLKNSFECYEINRDGDQSFHSLHAKIIADKTKSHTSIVVGSANATVRAWRGANWEAVVRFKSTPNYFKKLHEDLFVDSEAENRAALCVPYVPLAEEKVEDSPKEIFCNKLIRATIRQFVKQKSDSTVMISVSITPDDANREIKSVSFRVLGEADFHPADYRGGAWELTWEVPISSYSSILAIHADFETEGGEGSVVVNRCLNFDQNLIALRNKGLIAELVQTQGIHEILSAILEGVNFGFVPDLGDGPGTPWRSGDDNGLPVAHLESLVFLCLKNDPESMAKRAMISDIMSADFGELPLGTDTDRIERHRKLFDSVRELWSQISSEFPMGAS